MGNLAYRLNTPLGEPAIAAAGMFSAALVGVMLAAQVKIGVALLLALFFAGVVLVNLPLGLALWVPLVFLEGIPVFNLAGKAAGALIVVAWIGSMGSRRESVRAALRTHRPLLAIVGGLIVWLALTVAWADDVGLALEDLWRWCALGVMFVVLITTVTTETTVRWTLTAFVAGAVLSVAIGVADGSFTGEADGGARLEGAAGDPNYLAASIVASSVIAVSLLGLRMKSVYRWLTVGALVILILGLVSSGSRGGFLAAGVAVVMALIFFKGRRAHVVAATAVALGIGALAFLNVPDAWERVSDFKDDNGRSSLWTVGERMWEDAPVGGVGLNNFVVHSGDYVRQPGSLEHLKLVVERPHVPHNTYLQFLAESGVVGLLLFVSLCFASMRASLLAARRFEARGRDELGLLARGVLVATASILAAAMFLSAATDKRLWLLLALGPVLLGLALKGGARPAAPVPRSPDVGDRIHRRPAASLIARHP